MVKPEKKKDTRRSPEKRMLEKKEKLKEKILQTRQSTKMPAARYCHIERNVLMEKVYFHIFTIA
jgi:hypothetical protein